VEDELWIFEMTTKLTGVIFKKALLEDSFERVYRRVFEQILTKMFNNDVQVLEIFGDVGG